MRKLLALAVVAAMAVTASAAPSPPGDPKRPEPREVAAPVTIEERVPVSRPLPEAAAPDDCEPMAPTEGPPPKPYAERKVDEGETFAKQGLATLIQSEKERPAEEIAQLIERAVDTFFTALAADPYNPLATYNLAAAYARIGRNQCSMNLLARLSAMRDFHSVKSSVEDRADRLFGRGKKWKGKPDPDFNQLRNHPRFKEVTKGL